MEKGAGCSMEMGAEASMEMGAGCSKEMGAGSGCTPSPALSSGHGLGAAALSALRAAAAAGLRSTEDVYPPKQRETIPMLSQKIIKAAAIRSDQILQMTWYRLSGFFC